jgi:CheY-like chemotaxis protein
MELARVAIIEDKDEIRSLTRRALETANHTVVSEAKTREEAIELVDRVAAGDIEVDVYLLDGKLHKESAIGEDARIISQRMQIQRIGGHVIGFSIDELPEDVCHSSVENKDVLNAIKIMDDLAEPN